MRGGSANRSQTLMRWRVILQFIAILVMMAGALVRRPQTLKAGGCPPFPAAIWLGGNRRWL